MTISKYEHIYLMSNKDGLLKEKLHIYRMLMESFCSNFVFHYQLHLADEGKHRTKLREN